MRDRQCPTLRALFLLLGVSVTLITLDLLVGGLWPGLRVRITLPWLGGLRRALWSRRRVTRNRRLGRVL